MFNLIREILREDPISDSQWQARRLKENSCSLTKIRAFCFILYFALAIYVWSKMQVEMYPGNESRHKLNLGKKQRVVLNTCLSQYSSSKVSFYVLDIFFGLAKPSGLCSLESC